MSEASSTMFEHPAWPRVRATMRFLAVFAICGWVGFLVSAGALFWTFVARGDQTLAEQKPSGIPSLLVAPVMVAEPEVATPFPIQIGPATSIPRGSWIRIIGMPALASLSAEANPAPYSIGGGVWIVPVAALYDLSITTPQGFIRSEARITLMSSEGAPLAEVQSLLVQSSLCEPKPAIASWAIPPGVAGETFSRQLATVWSRYEDRREFQQRMQLGDDANFLEGGIGAARLWYQFAAERGWPPAAMALAQTYDPHEIAQRRLGIAPDPQRARHWYKTARDLMDASVDFYLARLDSSPKRPESPGRRGELVPMGFESPNPR